MPTNSRKNGARDAVIDRAINVGLAQSDAPPRDVQIELKLNDTQEKMVTDLCNLLGLSARSVLNASIRYTLHCARIQRVPAQKVKGFPRRLDGHPVPFLLTAETLAQVRETGAEEQVPACVVAGIKLLHEQLLRVTRTK